MRYDGGYDAKDGRTYKCVWPAIWDVCHAHGLSARELVEARFRSALSAKPPNPGEMTDPRFVAEAVRLRGKAGEEAVMVLERQRERLHALTALERRVGSDDPLADALYSRDGFNAPLARYLVAVKAGRADLAAAFLPDAAAELHLRRAVYDHYLTPHLPPELVRAADHLYHLTRTTHDSPADAGRTGAR